ncbi:cytochrome b5 domain-containing protein 1-like [Topomyia yanbarensis]|uniref:cytochrome b5 domain-containing protein 1-like n=1 Tax=Topomyia yanbarensis TaxID=2498891 RepID=UPI00273A8209|nr:cytochrome b5 domain-containing protein 1-like [Topomyia yanbarensis]XP_058839627.1 cytochrome b5 domain-containing protein 1-like [Topomyia yanbarensis]
MSLDRGGEKFFLRDEVVVRNQIDSAWVIIHGNVFDITSLFDANSSSLKKVHQLLLALAGKDLSVYFDTQRRPVYRISKDGARVPVFPPVKIRNSATGEYWWNDRSLLIGKITAQERKIRVVNNVTFQQCNLVVCEEDTIAEIRRKFLRFNDNGFNYRWRSNINLTDTAADLQLDRTLTGNGIIYDRYPPAPLIWLFYQIPDGSEAEETTPSAPANNSRPAAQVAN